MKIVFFLFLFFYFSLRCSSQDSSMALGHVEYLWESNRDTSNLNENINYTIVKLWFNKTGCVFSNRQRDAKDYPVFKNKKYTSVEDSLKDAKQITLFNKELNAQEKQLTYRGIRNEFAISSSKVGEVEYCVYNPIGKTDWELLPDTATIGNFLCHLAKGFYYGRIYFAWYAPDIPVPFGPMLMGGLPGLIMEASDTKKKSFFKLKQLDIPAKEQLLIICCKTGKKITLGEFNALQVKNMEDMKKMLESIKKKQGGNN